MSLSDLLSYGKRVSSRKGAIYVIGRGTQRLFHFIYCNKINFYKSDKFEMGGREYRYLYHYYNTTWYNARAVEIPIMIKIVRENPSQEILEVGNVLGHYFKFEHDVVDKYEKGRGVINKDILDFEPTKKYDLIVSISTLEHLGWDENVRDEMKPLLAIAKLKTLLNSNGALIVTFPFGYNPELDRMVKDSVIKFNELYFLKRISKCNEWIETHFDNIHNNKYNNPFPGANALLIGIIANETASP